MRVAIVDDTPRDGAELEEFVGRFCREMELPVEIVVFPGAEPFLSCLPASWDLVLLDIDMPGLNGVECARLLRRSQPDVVLMFITNMPQYALCGYEVEAVDYVLKPVSYPNFSLKMHKAMRYIRRNADCKLALNTQQQLVQVSVRDVVYVESMLHYLIYHTQRGDYKVRGTMSEAERTLQDHQFARCSSSFLVNLRYVQSIDRADVVVAGTALRMSRSRRKSFLERFNQFLGGVEP